MRYLKTYARQTGGLFSAVIWAVIYVGGDIGGE